LPAFAPPDVCKCHVAVVLPRLQGFVPRVSPLPPTRRPGPDPFLALLSSRVSLPGRHAAVLPRPRDPPTTFAVQPSPAGPKPDRLPAENMVLGVLTTGWRLNLSLRQVQGKNSMREDGCNGPSGCKVVKTSRTGSPAGSWFGFGLASKGWMMRGRGRITQSWQHGSAVALERDPGGARTPRRDRAPAFGRRQRTRTGNKPLETHGNRGNVEPGNVRRGGSRQRQTIRVRENP